MAVIETRDLTKVFKEGQLGAVNNVNLETREGEFLVFLGPSGSGKTTLLRMIAGLETPTSGEILIGGQVVNDLSPRERRIAMVFQSYALYPHLSVYKNIAFPLKAQNVKKELHKEKVEWAASLLGIGALLDRKPRELSGGERQRVALDPRPSTSRTIKWRPWPWATASWCSTKVSFASSALPPMSMTILLTLSSPLFSARRR